jgi:putative peptidoglycan lipid II flippase
MVGAGIFLSRIAGFIRARAMAHYLGNSDAADVFTYALKLPNLLQNLFGEGVLSASFIPAYVKLLEEKRDDEARRVAGAVASLLFLAVSVAVLFGVLAAPLIVKLFAAGYTGVKREECIRLVRIVFPGSGLLVLSAWCLGVLNSHRRFFLSYAAPVLWNAAIIAALVLEGRRTHEGYPLATAAAIGAVAGSLLQLLFQLPVVLVLLRGLRISLGRGSSHVRTVWTRFGPVVLGRGVVQIGGYVDAFIASFLLTGAMAGLSYAQTLYVLPISLFGMAISASELPEMARASGDAHTIAAQLRDRLATSLRRMAFFVIPSALAFLALGEVVVALIYRTGRFGDSETRFVWAILAGFSIGLYPATQARLYSSAFYALEDVTTPFRIAIVRVVVGCTLGAAVAFALPALLGVDRRWGIVGLALASAVSAWTEMLLLRRLLAARIGGSARLPAKAVALLVLAAVLAAGVGHATRVALAAQRLHPAAASALVLSAFGATYLLATRLLGVPEVRALTDRLRRRLKR